MTGLFVDVEEAVGRLLDPLTPGEEAVSKLEIDVPDRMPLIRATRLGGADDRITDRARVEVVVYAATRAQARQLAEQARGLLLNFPHRTSAGTIDYVETEQGPHESWAADPKQVRRWLGIYRVSVRRRSS